MRRPLAGATCAVVLAASVVGCGGRHESVLEKNCISSLSFDRPGDTGALFAGPRRSWESLSKAHQQQVIAGCVRDHDAGDPDTVPTTVPPTKPGGVVPTVPSNS